MNIKLSHKISCSPINDNKSKGEATLFTFTHRNIKEFGLILIKQVKHFSDKYLETIEKSTKFRNRWH